MFYLFAIPMLPFLCFALSAQPGQYTSTRDTVSDAREAAILNERKCVNPFRIFDGKLVDLRPVCAGIHAGNDKDTRFAFTASTGIEYMSGQILQVRDGGVLFQQGQRLDFIDHFPLAGTVDKMWATCFAKRVGEYTYTTKAGAPATIPKYDYGIVADAQTVKKILDSERDRTVAQAQAKKELDERNRIGSIPRVIAYQQQQASNGFPSFQFELGKRYLVGDGVETNRSLAIHWLKSACTNGSSEATNLLSKLP